MLKTVDDWFSEDGEIVLYLVFGILCRYVMERFEKGDFDSAQDLFNLIERFMVEGDVHVRNHITVGFLETLGNITGNDASLWGWLLGPKSKKACIELDRFWGTKTKGLDSAT